jgi:hypothetical protein
MQTVRLVRAGATVKVGLMSMRDRHGRYVALPPTSKIESQGIFLTNGLIGDWVMLLVAQPGNIQEN